MTTITEEWVHKLMFFSLTWVRAQVYCFWGNSTWNGSFSSRYQFIRLSNRPTAQHKYKHIRAQVVNAKPLVITKIAGILVPISGRVVNGNDIVLKGNWYLVFGEIKPCFQVFILCSGKRKGFAQGLDYV